MTWYLLGDSITLTLVTGFILLLTYYVYQLRTNNIFIRLGIPAPPPIPFLGEMFNFIRKGVNMTDMELFQKYGTVVGTYEGTVPIIHLSDPDLLRDVLIKDSHIFINRRSLVEIVGVFQDALTILKDDAWKNVRSIVSPTFSTAKLKSMFTLMNEISDIYAKRLLEYADKEEIFDCKLVNSQYTLDNIASCLFGIQTNSLENENATLISYMKKFFDLRITNFLLLLVFISPRAASFLGKFGYTILPNDSVAYVMKLLNEVIDRRRKRLERRNDFIQIMVDREEEVKHEETVSKRTLTDKEISAQALVFFTAGYETTSVFMSFFIYVMATEPAVQEKVYEEIRQELGDDEVTPEKLNQLPYLDMVMNETLRMYPPFIRFDRVASCDYQLGKYLIPKGSSIAIPVYPIHRNPAVWPNPEQFIPERFSAAEKAKRHPMSFLPFGDGPRNCIGMRFALIEAKLAIVKALRQVEIQRCEKTEIPIQLSKTIVLNVQNGIYVRAIRRSE